MEFITKADYAYAKLREDILNGTIKSGEKIQVNLLSEKYNLSSVPIRSAIVKLEEQGLINTIAHKGAYVARVNLMDYLSLMLLRIEAETSALMLAFFRMDNEFIKEINLLTENMEKAFFSGDAEEYSLLNRNIHTTIYNYCDNPIILQEVNNLMEKTKFARHTFSLLPKTMKSSIMEHKLLAESLEKRDLKKCIHVIRFQRCRSCLNLMDYAVEQMHHSNVENGWVLPEDAGKLNSFINIYSFQIQQNMIPELVEYNLELKKYF